MIEIAQTDFELQIRHLERDVERLGRELDQLRSKAGKSDESSVRPRIPGSTQFFRAQVTTAIPVMASDGTGGYGGAAILAVLVKGSGSSVNRYLRHPHRTISNLANDTGGAVAVNTMIVGAFVDGIPTVLVADCQEALAGALADMPHTTMVLESGDSFTSEDGFAAAEG